MDLLLRLDHDDPLKSTHLNASVPGSLWNLHSSFVCPSVLIPSGISCHRLSRLGDAMTQRASLSNQVPFNLFASSFSPYLPDDAVYSPLTQDPRRRPGAPRAHDVVRALRSPHPFDDEQLCARLCALHLVHAHCRAPTERAVQVRPFRLVVARVDEH
jgi:hypothetical protein